MFKIRAKDFISIPNILSYFRIILIFVFLSVYRREIAYKSAYLGLILVCSGISDVLDGYIARKYNMVTELGKCLDPIADKLTQFMLLFCLLSKYALAKVTLCVFLIKEVFVMAIGYRVVCLQGRNDGAKWYGKTSTVVFYVVTIVLVLFSDINTTAANVLLGFSAAALLGAFAGYMIQYAAIIRKCRSN
ncbi:MAG: CDP-alcohol phosphatidyltransferase family protein [Lachnospiraceae bacterium]|nr:CDP-alcohol phosphatidyltransferase family protein [Lachnospiraceae bacterium]